MKIVVTGGAGFVGSSLCTQLKEKYPHYEIIAFDNLKRRGSEIHLPRFQKCGITFVHGDIRNRSDFDQIENADCVIDAAAEPSVLAGLDGSPEYLLDSNLMGTINTLYFANKCSANFIFLSTSRVYPIPQIDKINFKEGDTRFELADVQSQNGVTNNGLAEDFSLEGARSFYGATKLASELLITEFNEYMNVKSVINRCGVIAGPWQMGKVDQGVMALWVARHFWQKPLSYIGYGGEGKQVRDVLHIRDLFELIDWQIHNIDQINGEKFNVGGGVKSSCSLRELTTLCEDVTGNRISISPVVETRDADIRIYITDNSKVTKICGWAPKLTHRDVVHDIHDWIKTNKEILGNFF